MRRKKKEKSSKEKSFFKEVLKEYGKSIAIAFGSVTVGIIIFFLTPLKDKVVHLIWKEDAEILISLETKNVAEGDSFYVDIIISPNSSIGISEGILSIDYSKAFLRLTSDHRNIKINKISSPYLLTEKNKIKFIGIKPGIAEITIKLITQYGEYEKKQKVEILAQTGKGKPSLKNFSGVWMIKIGHFKGKMEIRERGAQFQGNYFLDTGANGVIDGIRDGTVFKATFLKKSDLKWEVNANWKKVGDFLEIIGNAILYQDLNGWKAVAKNIEFFASAHLFVD